jgi:hypothetical protein
VCSGWGGPRGGGEGRSGGGQGEVGEDGVRGLGGSDEGDDAPVGAAVGTGEGADLVDADEEASPAGAGGGAVRRVWQLPPGSAPPTEAVGPRRCRRVWEGAAGRGPAGAGRRGCGHGPDGASRTGAAEWRDGQDEAVRECSSGEGAGLCRAARE